MKIAFISGGRSDLNLIQPIFETLKTDFDLKLYLTGQHRELPHGEDWIAHDTERIECVDTAESPLLAAQGFAQIANGLSTQLQQQAPDLLFVVGDRFEMLAAASVATVLTIPIAHVHGGEITEGAFDDAIRHALTKLSHLHFVSHDDAARRLRQMGEEPWRVHISGAPALDRLRQMHWADRQELECEAPFLLITLHAETLRPEDLAFNCNELLAALERVPQFLLFTGASPDPGGNYINEQIKRFCRNSTRRRFISNLGSQRYWNLMRHAAALVGNSSSALLEAPTLHVPAVNIGDRQKGRPRAASVIDCEFDRHAIIRAIERVQSAEFQQQLPSTKNPFGDGDCGSVIRRVLSQPMTREALLRKKFCEVKV